MIIQFYRTNQPVVNIGTPVIGLIMWGLWHFFLYTPVHENVSQNGLLPLPDFPFNWISPLLMTALVVLQALQFNKLINDNELYDKQFYLPGLVYVLTAWMFNPGPQLNWPAAGNLFLLLAFRQLLQVYRRHDSRRAAFNTGLWFGVAVICTWQIFPLFLFIIAGLTILKTVNWREILLFLTAMTMPFFFMEVIAFVCFEKFIVPSFSLPEFSFSLLNPGPEHDYRTYAFWLLLLLCLISVFMLIGRLSGVIMKVRQQRLVMLLLSLVLMTLAVAMMGWFNGSGVALLVIPVTLLLSFLLVHTRFRMVSDLFVYAILTLIFLDRLI